MPVQCYVDATGLLRSSAPGHEGDLLDMAASAYDTCVNLGQDPLYAGDTMLPAKVVAYYEPFGTYVLEHAALGWIRGRGFTMRDPWHVMPDVDKGRKAPRKVPAKQTVITTDPAAGPATWFTEPPASSTRSKGAKNLVRYGEPVKIDVDTVVLTAAVIAGLSKDTKVLMRQHLTPQEWMPRPLGDGTTECRTVGQVFRTCRRYGVVNGPWHQITECLRRELSWHRPVLHGFLPADL